ncbi:MAG: ferritin-like domain-containing protein [Pedobacter sp.]|uniref:ferritin-like domain-containing protein n=1 Tax=Pedobacter sp. TaxID=1411316 RepID=UPI0035646A50
MTKGNSEMETESVSFFGKKIQRRHFFQFASASVLIAGVAGCKKSDAPGTGNPFVNVDNTIDFADLNDTGLLNYIYAFEQLEAAFYLKLKESFPAALTNLQRLYFIDIASHEVAHREFYKNFLGSSALGTLTFDFSTIDFTDVQSVLAAAKIFEDLGVAAYNGVIARSKQLHTVVIASQVASVEARHAAWIRNQITPNSFADLTEMNAIGAVAIEGRDALLSPAEVLSAASKYIITKLNVINL